MTNQEVPSPEQEPVAREDCGACCPPDRTVGVLLVHGMGEQKPGDHAERVVRSLIASWESDYEVSQVCGKPNVCPTCLRPIDTARWSGDGVGAKPGPSKEPPQIIVRVQLSGEQSETVDLHFHEVWWADLGQRPGFWNWVRFVWWVASAPFRVCGARTGKFDDEPWMQRAHAAGLQELKSPRRGLGRVPQFLVLCCFSLLALLTVPTWGLLRRVLRGFAPSPVTLLQSFGDVQIYTERARPDTGTGSDMGLPPRVPIRRRIVQEMVAMAEREYDQWYVMAHSLGSVAAFNGLMEPDYLLPNYLEQEHWHRLDERFKKQGTGVETEKMRPRRPLWLKPDDALSRKKLFRRLGGFVTYGSPLHVFLDLWPHIVMVNKNNQNLQWLNVCSPFDPMSGALRAFRRSDLGLHLKVLRFSGNRLAFFAHGAYLKARARSDVGYHLGKWWLRGKKPTTPRGVQWPAWLVAFSQILLASVALLGLFLGELGALVGLACKFWDVLLVSWEELCCLARLTVL